MGVSNVCNFSSTAVRNILLDHSIQENSLATGNGLIHSSISYISNPVTSSLELATFNGDFEAVDFLLSRGVDIEASGLLGGSNCLIVAVSAGHLHNVKYLLDKGASMHGHGKYGNLLQTACYFSRKDIVVELLDRKLDINLGHDQHDSALITAVTHMDRDLVEIHAARGADITICHKNYGTPLHVAAQLGMKDTVKLLVDAAANVNAEGSKYGTALQASEALLVLLNLETELS